MTFRAKRGVVLAALSAILVCSSGCEVLDGIGANGPKTNPPYGPGEPAGRRLPTANPISGQGAKTFDIKNLVTARLGIPSLPSAPLDPAPQQVRPEQVANRPAVFRGAADLKPPVAQGQIVTVMGREQLVGERSAPGQFICDLLAGELRSRGVLLADRDYRVVKRDEANDIRKEQGENTVGLIALTDEENQKLVAGEQSVVRYAVIVHRVEVPNNPVQVVLPWIVPPAEWTRYEQEKRAFLAAVAAYNKGVDAYRAAVDVATKEINAAGSADVRLLYDGKELFSEGGVSARDRLAVAVETAEPVKERLAREQRDRGQQSKARLARSSEVAQARAAQSQTEMPVNAAGFPSLVGFADMNEQWQALSQQYNGMTDQVERIRETDYRLFNSADEVLDVTVARPMAVSAFQGALSVRVIDLRTSEPVWIGLASAQNLDYANAMADACAKIASLLVNEPAKP